jgi:Histone acetyl transferase HAT1 N-terminus
VNHSAILKSASSVVDDVEGMLSTVIPQGALLSRFSRKRCVYPPICADYYKNEVEFQKRVDDDATSFQPCGQMIYSYTRPSPTFQGKGKRPANSISSEGEDTVAFEVYHVSCKDCSYSVPVKTSTAYCRRLGILPVLKSFTDGCRFSFSYTSRLDHTSTKRRNLGNLWFCAYNFPWCCSR